MTAAAAALVAGAVVRIRIRVITRVITRVRAAARSRCPCGREMIHWRFGVRWNCVRSFAFVYSLGLKSTSLFVSSCFLLLISEKAIFYKVSMFL